MAALEMSHPQGHWAISYVVLSGLKRSQTLVASCGPSNSSRTRISPFDSRLESRVYLALGENKNPCLNMVLWCDVSITPPKTTDTHSIT